MGERPSEFRRDVNDWYIEPSWAVEALRDRVHFDGWVHDPCCGRGTIPSVIGGSGSDLVDRGYGYPVQDYLQDTRVQDNIITNPPYGIGQKIIEHALAHTKRRVAALMQLRFLATQARNPLFSRQSMEHVIIFSRRPSMPPGKMLQEHGEKIRGGGSIEFCWMVWNNEHTGSKPTIEWAK